MNGKRKVALYIRKSREGEGDLSESETLYNQRQTLLNLCEEKSYTEYDLYEEVESSINFNRPKLSSLIANIEEYGKILVVHIDRIGRDIGLLDEIKKLCMAHNVEIETPYRTIDFSSDDEELLYGFSSVLSDYEYKRIKQRLLRGKIDAVKLKGRWVTEAPTGYTVNKETMKLEPDDRAAGIKMAFDLALKGFTHKEIAAKLNELGFRTSRGTPFTSNSLHPMLKNRAYIGETHYSSKSLDETVVVKDTHEPLVSAYDFRRVQELTASRATSKAKQRTLGLKSAVDGLLFCPICEYYKTIKRPLSSYNKKRMPANVHKCRYPKRSDGTPCPNRGFPAHVVMDAVYNELDRYKDRAKEELKHILHEDNSVYVNGIKERIKSLEGNIKKKESSLERLLDLYVEGSLNKDMYTKRKDSINEEIATLQVSISDSTDEINRMDSKEREKSLKIALSNMENLKTKDLDEQNRVLRLLIDKIEAVRLEEELNINIVWI